MHNFSNSLAVPSRNVVPAGESGEPRRCTKAGECRCLVEGLFCRIYGVWRHSRDVSDLSLLKPGMSYRSVFMYHKYVIKLTHTDFETASPRTVSDRVTIAAHSFRQSNYCRAQFSRERCPITGICQCC